MKFKGWNSVDVENWSSKQEHKRSYEEEVKSKIDNLKLDYNVISYGEIEYDKKYELFLISPKVSDSSKPNILITGGVHGYETSGVQGALKFISEEAPNYLRHFNIYCAPCISPWGYETINRWNPDAIDPNRNFYKNSPAQECSLIYDKINELNLSFLAHFDLHETTDTDNTVFRPALEQRDGIEQDLWEIPDGFYLVADSKREQIAFQEAIINSVEKVTHIAPSDKDNKIIGVEISSKGIINYDVQKLNLCAGLTNAKYVTTTEVYPDSPKVNDDECNRAQVAAVKGGLNYLKELTNI